jgi:hypothetical protein
MRQKHQIFFVAHLGHELKGFVHTVAVAAFKHREQPPDSLHGVALKADSVAVLPAGGEHRGSVAGLRSLETPLNRVRRPVFGR